MLIEGDIYNTLISEYFIVENDQELFNFAIEMLSNRGNRNPNHVIYLTDECNQRCAYCFEKSVDILGKENKVLTYEQIDKIINNISEVDSLDRKKGTITLFGGEPLLEKNIKFLNQFFKGIKLISKFSKLLLVTNGINVCKYIKDIISWGIDEVQITLDGTEKVQNKRRIVLDKNLNGFEKIQEGIGMLLKNGVKVFLRINIDKNNVNEVISLGRFII